MRPYIDIGIDESPEVAAKAAARPERALVVAPAYQDGRLRVVTEHDLAKAVSRGASPDTCVSELAHPWNLAALSPDVSILEAARLMLGAEVGQVTVTDAGEDARVSICNGS